MAPTFIIRSGELESVPFRSVQAGKSNLHREWHARQNLVHLIFWSSSIRPIWQSHLSSRWPWSFWMFVRRIRCLLLKFTCILIDGTAKFRFFVHVPYIFFIFSDIHLIIFTIPFWKFEKISFITSSCRFKDRLQNSFIFKSNIDHRFAETLFTSFLSVSQFFSYYATLWQRNGGKIEFRNTYRTPSFFFKRLKIFKVANRIRNCHWTLHNN